MDLSMPLRDMPLLRAAPWEGIREVPIKRRRADRRPTLDLARDPVLQDATATGLSPGGTVITTFDGTTNLNGVLPPDTNGDIGPNHYVQWINLSAQIFNRAGTSLLGPFNGNQFFAGFGGPCQTRNDGDPIALYDHLADRWVVSQFVTTAPYALCVAVSQTPDPTGAYFRYQFNFGTNFPDYPKMGVWPDGYYVTTRSFPDGGGFQQQAVVMDRVRMLAGLSASMVLFNIPDAANIDGFLPVDLDGPAPPAGTPGIFAGLPFYGPTTNQIRLYGLSVNWTTPASSTFTSLGTLPVAAFSAPSDVVQPGTAVGLDVLHFFLMYRLQYRNFGTHQTLVTNHSVNAGSGRSGVRWYELRKVGAGAWGLHQQGTYAPADGLSRWMGSIAMNAAGDIGLAYSVSSAAVFPSLRFTGQTAANSGSGLMDVPETSIHAGGGSQTNSSGRWGDYSSLSVDPTNDGSFWFTSEYLSTSGNANWRTRIARFAVGSGQPPPVASVTPASVDVTVAPGGTTTADVTIANTAAAGAQSLNWSANIVFDDPLAPAPTTAAATAAPSGEIALVGDPDLKGRTDDDAGTGTAGTGTADLGAGGPDAFGYVWADSDEAGGPPVAFQDISATGTPIAGWVATGTFSALDEGYKDVPLPFPFPFYGATHNAVRVNTNGLLHFTSFAANSFSNVGIPNATDPDALIAPFWDDLDMSQAAGGTVYTGTLPDGRFVVQFHAVKGFNQPASAFTFQVLFSADGRLEYQYGTMTGTLNGATVGIEDPTGAVGLQVAFNAAYVASNKAVRFTSPTIWASVAPSNGVVAPGGAQNATLTFDAAELAEGTYTATLNVATNDPAHPTVAVPLTLTVGDTAPAIAVTEPLPRRSASR